MAEILIKTNKDNIAGDHIVAIVGPNGAGKTTFGAELARLNGAAWISATRNLQFEDSIPMQTPEQARSQVESLTNDQKNRPWLQSNELNQLLAKLKAEDADAAIKFRNNYIKSSTGTPETTKIIQLTNLWNNIFPERDIDLSSYSPKAKANHRSGSSPYGISRMSGGERVALYLLARVLDAPEGLIFVDEPELHFHEVLARKFWSVLEIARPECRFVYITHDLQFAVSRNNVQFIVVYSDIKQDILPQQTGVPDEIIDLVLGAATFSITAKKIIFCEGSRGNKRDDELYTLWFKDKDVAVVPVGNCEEVIKCVDVFNKNSITQGLKAFGIIDRDYRSDDFFTDLPTEVKALPLHEIECLFCAKEIFAVIGKHLLNNDIESKYKEIVSDFKKHFKENKIEKNKTVLERVKQRTYYQSRKLLNSVHPTDDILGMKGEYLNALKIENWGFDPDKFFEEEKNRIDTILDNDNADDVLKIFPGKTILGLTATKLGISNENYINIILSALSSNNAPSDPVTLLKNDLKTALQKYIPAI